ncbi:15922_t:CDS:2 [Cetraspora pellucida]|uniref:15922_t:CDS:1 n=1 Tax=Cetraspora pellucida TaxID=1433469 RepID=A0A9N9G3U7_9GLOM|nr:15922_t:CDS:2 [Cetraspora pellucida]
MLVGYPYPVIRVRRNNDGHLVLKKPNISAFTFEIILKYLYCGIVDFKRQKKETILELLIAVDELGIQRLINSVQEFLIQNCLRFLQFDLMKMLNFITCHNSFDNLKKASLNTLTKNCKNFLQQDPVTLLHFIIHHETFNDLRKTSLDSIYFKTLEKSLYGLIQLIRFHQMNREEFMLEFQLPYHFINHFKLDWATLKSIRF